MVLEIAAAGNKEFTAGFRLAGIKKTFDLESTPIKDLLADKEIGILILDSADVSRLSEHSRMQLQSSTQPVAVVLSKEGGAEDNLRKLIKKSIGVDLWK